MKSALPSCKTCQATLEFKQTCLNVYWYCHHCGKRHPLEDFLEYLDDAMEERLAQIRCNRI